MSEPNRATLAPANRGYAAAALPRCLGAGRDYRADGIAGPSPPAGSRPRSSPEGSLDATSPRCSVSVPSADAASRGRVARPSPVLLGEQSGSKTLSAARWQCESWPAPDPRVQDSRIGRKGADLAAACRGRQETPRFRPNRQRGGCRGACSQSLAKHQRWPVGGWRLLLGGGTSAAPTARALEFVAKQARPGRHRGRFGVTKAESGRDANGESGPAGSSRMRHSTTAQCQPLRRSPQAYAGGPGAAGSRLLRGLGLVVARMDDQDGYRREGQQTPRHATQNGACDRSMATSADDDHACARARSNANERGSEITSAVLIRDLQPGLHPPRPSRLGRGSKHRIGCFDLRPRRTRLRIRIE